MSSARRSWFVPSVAVMGLSALLLSSTAIWAAKHKAAPKPTAMPTATAEQIQAALGNLSTAYQAEVGAKAAYQAYAQKADKQGYKKVAELFRAAAKTKEGQSGFKAKIITDLGGAVPQVAETKLKVKGTKENLEAAIKDISGWVETTYPGYAEQAQNSNIAMAAMSFGSAMKVTANTKIFLEEALANLKEWKKASGGFYVCNICGNVEDKLDFEKCAVCGYPVSEFAQVK